MQFEKLFEPGRIGTLRVKNRVVQAPLSTEYSSRDGSVTPRLIRYIKERAIGGVGLILPGYAYIDTKGSQSQTCQLGVYDDHCIPGLAMLAETIKENGARAGLQISHCGRQRFLGTYPMVAPSRIPWEELVQLGGVIPTELTIEEIGEIVEAFGRAARRAKQAGFEMVEVHGAHGYLITEFLSQHTNKRTDWYGGSLENRMRFPLEVVESVRRRVGKNYPLGMRVTADEYEVEGVTLDESKIFAKRLEEAGVDVIHVSAGNHHTTDRSIEPMYYPLGAKVHLAEAIKKVVNIPVIASGSITTPELAEKILQEGKADFISLGRPLVADPYFVMKAKEGRPKDIVPCIRCLDGCLVRGVEQSTGLKCTVNVVVGKEEYATIDPAPKSRNIIVVGGGPAGMEAARVAALRGHRVTLYEKRALGGLMVEASTPEFKKDIRSLIEYYITQLEKLDITIIKEKATAQRIEREKFDAVIVATGSTPIIPAVPGVDKPSAVTTLDVLRGKDIGSNIIVIGGGLVGCETALFLAQQGGKKVKIVEMEEKLIPAGDVHRGILISLINGLQKYAVELHLGVRLEEITNEGVIGADRHGKKKEIKGDTIVLALGMRPNDELARSLREREIEFIQVGDCVEPRKIFDAIHEGHIAARRL